MAVKLCIVLILLGGVCGGAPAFTTPGEGMDERTRLLVLTDIGGDPDDEQSLIRLLVHADEFDIEGILCEHWGKSHRFSPSGQMALVAKVLDAYGEVQPALVRHADGYPSAGRIRWEG